MVDHLTLWEAERVEHELERFVNELERFVCNKGSEIAFTSIPFSGAMATFDVANVRSEIVLTFLQVSKHSHTTYD